jgi:hypothetical protein
VRGDWANRNQHRRDTHAIVAGRPHDRWLVWHRRWGELAPPGTTADAIREAQRAAYLELADGDPA